MKLNNGLALFNYSFQQMIAAVDTGPHGEDSIKEAALPVSGPDI